MRFICTGGPYGDCTSRYDVELDRPTTVREFVNEVLKQNEWGDIIINDGDGVFSKTRCEYSRDKLKTEPLPEKYMDKLIVKCKAHGGWSNMDYLIYLEEVAQ